MTTERLAVPPRSVIVALARALCQPWGREALWPRYDRGEAEIDGSPPPGQHVARHLRKAELVLDELAENGYVVVRVGVR